MKMLTKVIKQQMPPLYDMEDPMTTFDRFKDWLEVVDMLLEDEGAMRDDLPDQPWYDWWRDDCPPEEAVTLALEDWASTLDDDELPF